MLYRRHSAIYRLHEVRGGDGDRGEVEAFSEHKMNRPWKRKTEDM